MSKLGDLYKDEEWLKIMYIEAWKQYSHEDDLGQSRMTLFLAVHAALIAIVGAVAKPLADIEPLIINSHEFHIGLCILGVLAFLTGLFSLVLSGYWKVLTQAGRRYLNLRWIPIAVIEKVVGLDRINIANLEHEWREFSRNNPGCVFYPYPDIEELKHLLLDPLPKIRSWSSMEKTITLIQVLDVFLAIVGILLLFITYSLWN